MPSARNPSSKPGASIANATAKTRSLIEGLQARLAAEAQTRTAQPDATNPETESIEDLEQQLKAYFDRAASKPSSQTPLLDDLRNRVVEGVVNRILAEWADPQSAGSASVLARQVMDLLVERVLEELQKQTHSL